MSRRFINCTACKGCHTGRGGRYCPFIPKTSNAVPAGDNSKMAAAEVDPSVPDRDSAEYEPYLAQKILDEEDKLKRLQDRSRISEMEAQLARLRLQSAELENPHDSPGSPRLDSPGSPRLETRQETGVASALLAASLPADPANTLDGRRPVGALSSSRQLKQRTKEEKETLSKLRALNHLQEVKSIEKITYREFVSAMSKVAQLICEMGIDPLNYVAHMGFIFGKASLNLYATDAMIKYEAAVTERVISGQYFDWAPADPECVALHLGADATYAVRQGGGRWSRPTSGFSATSRDFSDWPKDVCWLFNNTSCYFPRCKKAHVCCRCKKQGHPMKDCKSQDESTSPSSPEVLSAKPQKEARKP